MGKRKKWVQSCVSSFGKVKRAAVETLSPRQRQKKSDHDVTPNNENIHVSNLEDAPERLNSDPENFQTTFRLDGEGSVPSSPMKSFRLRFPLASMIQSISSPRKSKLAPTGIESTARIPTSRSVQIPANVLENHDADNISYLAQRYLQRDQVSIDALMLDSETINASSTAALSSAISVNSSSVHAESHCETLPSMQHQKENGRVRNDAQGSDLRKEYFADGRLREAPSVALANAAVANLFLT
ncbi:hypothetical protein DFH05DRAFT_1530611 [Lentinula detonsa]|uniref:Uncharacterized protein n=1 Tax=Lentinula detonsa TaxID=2804962 RepID=A0A9W8TSQ3_9AGAR|nr:hypothetical protein DFH05DRAFT_1530611 [Lentinula detonsa]